MTNDYDAADAYYTQLADEMRREMLDDALADYCEDRGIDPESVTDEQRARFEEWADDQAVAAWEAKYDPSDGPTRPVPDPF